MFCTFPRVVGEADLARAGPFPSEAAPKSAQPHNTTKNWHLNLTLPILRSVVNRNILLLFSAITLSQIRNFYLKSGNKPNVCGFLTAHLTQRFPALTTSSISVLCGNSPPLFHSFKLWRIRQPAVVLEAGHSRPGQLPGTSRSASDQTTLIPHAPFKHTDFRKCVFLQV